VNGLLRADPGPVNGPGNGAADWVKTLCGKGLCGGWGAAGADRAAVWQSQFGHERGA
jgi:hypothetical protein